MNLPNNDIEGNQLIYIDHDGNILCCDCMQNEINNDRQNPDAVCGSVHWEGDIYNCSDCKVELEPVYSKIDNFKKELKTLLNKYKVTLGVDLNGDTHCLETNFIVNDNETNKETILGHYSAYLDASDLD